MLRPVGALLRAVQRYSGTVGYPRALQRSYGWFSRANPQLHVTGGWRYNRGLYHDITERNYSAATGARIVGGFHGDPSPRNPTQPITRKPAMHTSIIPQFSINQVEINTESGLYCLNDLHKASEYAGDDHKKPSKWLENASAKQHIEAISQSRNSGLQKVIETIHGGAHQGTYGTKLVVMAYAMWLSPVFHVKVAEAFLAPRSLSRLELAKEQVRLIEELEAAEETVKTLNIELDSAHEWATIKRMEALTGERYCWRRLKAGAIEINCPRKDIFDANYGSVKSYHKDLWLHCYDIDIEVLLT